MQDNQQFEQLMLQYNQLLNGSKDIEKMIADEDYDAALPLLASQRDIFLNCNNILKFLELTEEQKETVNQIKKEISTAVISNVETIKSRMTEVQSELLKIKNLQKFQNAYEANTDSSGSIIDYNE